MTSEALWDLPAPPDSTPRPASLEDSRLIARLRAGDEHAFETLYRRHSGSLFALSHHLTRQRTDAEELTQEVFTRAWQRRTSFHNADHFARWLRRVAVNTWINGLRHRRTTESLEDDEERDSHDGSPTTSAAPAGLRLDLQRALGELTPRLRAVLLLFDLYGLRHVEIAEMLEITPGASKVQLHRARTRLREMLA
jgi:RNA polymerase sigma-70 factor (ECF subfamily)